MFFPRLGRVPNPRTTDIPPPPSQTPLPIYRRFIAAVAFPPAPPPQPQVLCPCRSPRFLFMLPHAPFRVPSGRLRRRNRLREVFFRLQWEYLHLPDGAINHVTWTYKEIGKKTNNTLRITWWPPRSDLASGNCKPHLRTKSSNGCTSKERVRERGGSYGVIQYNVWHWYLLLFCAQCGCGQWETIFTTS
jgi:hypothetical protein